MSQRPKRIYRELTPASMLDIGEVYNAIDEAMEQPGDFTPRRHLSLTILGNESLKRVPPSADIESIIEDSPDEFPLSVEGMRLLCQEDDQKQLLSLRLHEMGSPLESKVFAERLGRKVPKRTISKFSDALIVLGSLKPGSLPMEVTSTIFENLPDTMTFGPVETNGFESASEVSPICATTPTNFYKSLRK